jgi:hypothetical protein
MTLESGTKLGRCEICSKLHQTAIEFIDGVTMLEKIYQE